MKALLLTDSAAFAGTERHMLDLTWALRELGVDATLACPDEGETAVRAREEKLPVFALESRGVRGAMAAINILRRGLRARRWDVVHAHNGRSALLAAVARFFARRGALVTTQHFIDPARTKRRGWRATLAGAVHRWIDRQTGAVVAISEAVKAALLRRDGTSPDRVQVVLNGVRDPAAGELREAGEVRAGLGVPPGAPLIVCVCRLEPEKSVEVLVRAMAEVIVRFPAAVCVVGGAGSEETRIAEEIDKRGLGRVVRLAGFQRDPHSLMRAGSVFVLPSRAEPFGLALVEAMALGRACVATRAGGPLEIVEEGVSGLLVPPDDPGALAGALGRLLEDAGLRERLGAGARARYDAKFTVIRMGKGVRAAYRAALREE